MSFRELGGAHQCFETKEVLTCVSACFNMVSLILFRLLQKSAPFLSKKPVDRRSFTPSLNMDASNLNPDNLSPSDHQYRNGDYWSYYQEVHPGIECGPLPEGYKPPNLRRGPGLHHPTPGLQYLNPVDCQKDFRKDRTNLPEEFQSDPGTEPPSPLLYFRLFLTDDVLLLLANNTNRYAESKNASGPAPARPNRRNNPAESDSELETDEPSPQNNHIAAHGPRQPQKN